MNISEECYNDIKEMVINEVSVGALARATENNLPKRKKQSADAIKATKAGWKEYEEQSKKEEVAKQLRLGLKENLKSAIQKYAKGDEWHKLNLEDKAADIQGKELKQAMQREGRDKVIAKRVDTKNEIGSKKTDYRRPIPNENIKEESEYDKNMKIANDYDKLMMKQPAQSPDGSKNSVANYYQTKYQEYFDKAMQARHAEQSKKHPEEESALYKKAEITDKAASKQLDKAEHAQDLANLNLPKNSKVNANKLFKAAHKVTNDREDKMMNAHKNGESAKQFVRRLKRSDRADDILIADPVKSRVTESLIDEAMSILEKVSAN